VKNTFVALPKSFGTVTKVFFTLFPVSIKNVFFKIFQMKEETIFLLQSKKKKELPLSHL
jgi:hypothetical protein